ncbi:substrate-binding protein-like domain-containing protein [Sinosporangium album]|uniref:Substrate-binding protein-like domain-containing protein n=1 Tax=Sinosporangium album TaxID=504805 RepID=A0A1G8B3W7_9ACTN|nr:substrate-binding protein-like domain-containing protein [Sinosporangium album]
MFCFADPIAYGVYAAEAERGLRIPDDVSVMGYDDHPMSALLTPGLTSVNWDIDGIVRAAVRLVVEAVDADFLRSQALSDELETSRGERDRADLGSWSYSAGFPKRRGPDITWP